MVPIETVSDLIGQIKLALRQSEKELEKSGLILKKVQLELKVTADNQASTGSALRLIPVQLSGDYGQSAVQTIHLSMIPVSSTYETLTSARGSELKNALSAIHAVIREAAHSEARFAVAEAIVTLKIGVRQDGAIQIVAGADSDEQTVQKIMLTIGTK